MLVPYDKVEGAKNGTAKLGSRYKKKKRRTVEINTPRARTVLPR
jgi:hypothetical protein